MTFVVDLSNDIMGKSHYFWVIPATLEWFISIHPHAYGTETKSHVNLT